MCTHTGAHTHRHTHTLRLSCLPKICSQLPPGQATLTFAPPGRSHKTCVSFYLRTHCVPSLTPDVPPRPGLWAPGSPLISCSPHSQEGACAQKLVRQERRQPVLCPLWCQRTPGSFGGGKHLTRRANPRAGSLTQKRIDTCTRESSILAWEVPWTEKPGGL